MDRKAWISIGLCVVALFAWQWYYQKTYGEAIAEQNRARAAAAAERAAQEEAATTPAPTSTPSLVSSDAASTSAPPSLIAESTPTLVAPQLGDTTPDAATPAEELTITSDAMELRFTSRGGGLRDVRLTEHEAEEDERIILNEHRTAPIGDLAMAPEQFGITDYSMRREGNSVIFERSDLDKLEVSKTFTLPEAEAENERRFVTQLRVNFRNVSDVPVKIPGYYISAGSIVPVHDKDLITYTGFSHNRSDKTKFIDVNWFRAGNIPVIGIQTRPARDSFLEQDPSSRWVAVQSQYFTTILTPTQAESAIGAWAQRFDVPGLAEGSTRPGIEGAIAMTAVELAPGATLEHTFEIYTGPKKYRWLSRFEANQDDIMRYGMFKIVSITLLNSMNAIQSVVGLYAVAIIILTLVIKSLLWPLQNKATKSMRKMAALSPKMTELRAKYKDDPTKMNQELMKLYKDYGVNPFGGCLPMLVQIPIFFGFYSMLGTAVELRNSRFLWVDDLSQPDTIFRLFDTVPVNILPLVMAATMLWQMKITPKTGDAVQQRIFMFMPLIFLIFCYNFASALALYWTVQNLFSVVQLYLTRDKPLPAMTKVKPAENAPVGPGAKRKRKNKRP